MDKNIHGGECSWSMDNQEGTDEKWTQAQTWPAPQLLLREERKDMSLGNCIEEL